MATRGQREKEKKLNDMHQMILTNMLNEPENKYCSECGVKGPRWASWNLGIFMCIRCSGIHRNLGVHISKVRSVNLDTWRPEWIESMQAWGNKKAAALWEYHLPRDYKRPVENDQEMESFIRSKYERSKFKRRADDPPLADTPAPAQAQAHPSAATAHHTTATSSASHQSHKKLGHAGPVIPHVTPVVAPLQQQLHSHSHHVQHHQHKSVLPPATAATPHHHQAAPTSTPTPAPAPAAVPSTSQAQVIQDDLFGLLGPAQPPSQPGNHSSAAPTATNGNGSAAMADFFSQSSQQLQESKHASKMNDIMSLFSATSIQPTPQQQQQQHNGFHQQHQHQPQHQQQQQWFGGQQQPQGFGMPPQQNGMGSFGGHPQQQQTTPQQGFGVFGQQPSQPQPQQPQQQRAQQQSSNFFDLQGLGFSSAAPPQPQQNNGFGMAPSNGFGNNPFASTAGPTNSNNNNNMNNSFNPFAMSAPAQPVVASPFGQGNGSTLSSSLWQ